GVIFQTEDQEYILFLAIHHIIADGWSMGILIRESISIYESYVSRQKIELPPLPLQYADYAVWERNWLKGEKLEKQLGYWKKKLDGVATYKGFSTTRPKVESFQGSKYSFRLDKELMQGLRLMSEKKAVTLFMNLLSAFKFLLHSYSKQSDIVVGTDVASRQEKSIELLIGFFVNQLVLRTDLSGNPSYTELLERVRDVTLEAYSHQEVPFDKLVEVLKPEREGNSMPLFQVKMVLQNNPLPPLSIPDLSIELLEFHNNTAKYDLLLNLTETVEGIVGYFEYSTSIFSLPMIELLFNQYEAILKTVIVEPSIRLDKLQEVMTKVSHRQQLEQKQSLKAVGREKLKNIRREGYTKSQTGD
ncbi:MAG: AMP-dependent synthetase, partial [Blastocatellia bacterium]|nr:AMP-dependent synthetase [Blastocatellia bacterium]